VQTQNPSTWIRSSSGASARRSVAGRRVGALLVGLIFLTLVQFTPVARAQVPDGLRPQLDRNHEIERVGWGFFDLASGQRVARLEIERIVLGYRRQGFFRVAWRPQVRMEGVTLDIASLSGWAVQAGDLQRALRELAGGDELFLTRVRIRVAGDSPRLIEADSAVLTREGDLRLVGARQSPELKISAPAGDLLLGLTGARAGQITAAPPAPSRLPVASVSSKAQPNPILP